MDSTLLFILRLFYPATQPPSTTIVLPVIYEDSSDAKNNTALEISSGFPILFIGTGAIIASNPLGSIFEAATPGVSIAPGAMQFTRIPKGANSKAIACDIATIPPFEAQ